jgi:uncharacterized protein (DUF1499 family)
MQKRWRVALIMTLLSTLVSACSGERPQNLGIKSGILAPCPASPNCVSSFAVDDQHRIAPLVFTGDPDAAFARLKATLSSRGDATVIEEHAGYLRVELRTTLFVDDAEFLLDRERQVFQVRSASRLGYSDLGKNRSRMEEIRAQFSR